MFRDTETFSSQDESFFRWLSLIQCAQYSQVSIDGNTVKVVCPEALSAKRLWKRRHWLQPNQGLKLDIRVGEEKIIYAIGLIED